MKKGKTRLLSVTKLSVLKIMLCYAMRHAMRHPKTRANILLVVGKEIQKEMTKLSAKKTNSCLRQRDLAAMQIFTWDSLVPSTSYVTKIIISVFRHVYDYSCGTAGISTSQQAAPMLSHTRTLAMLDKLGENFDAEVHQWMANFNSTL